MSTEEAAGAPADAEGADSPGTQPDSRGGRVLEVALQFLKLGCTAFGGPAAHVGLMEDEFVKRRRWLSRQQFLDLLGATNLIPGPNSTEMCIHLGYRRAGLPGLVAAGAGFIIPAALISGTLAWAYLRFGSLPALGFVLYGIKPAVLAVILGAIVRLGRTAFRGTFLVALGLASLGLSLAGVDEIVVLLGGGGVGALRVAARRMRSPPGGGSSTPGLLLLGAPLATTASTAAAPAVGLLPLGAFFLKVGSVLYGSGYVLLAFLRGGLVQSYGWLTETQLLDAISIGQFTPGPLLSTSTFIGYLLRSWPGAIVATLGVFLPSFIFVLLTHRWVFRLRSSTVLGGFLDAVNATAVGLMAAVVLQLGQAALAGWPAWVIGLGAAAGVLLTRVNPTWWILGGGGLGVLAWTAGWVAP